jgi:hypothetical protein
MITSMPLDFINFIVFDFRENQLFFQAQCVIATAVEGRCAYTAEVAHAGQSDVHEFIEEFVHAVCHAALLSTPIGMPSRSLNAAMDFLAFVTTGFWPAMVSQLQQLHPGPCCS